MKGTFYIGTVCLERNRWGSRSPSFLVSDWLPRFKADGFDGVELWENHYVAADAAEQARLAGAAHPVAIYNSYVSFGDEGAAAREQAAAAVARLGVSAVKYNVGPDPAALACYRRTLLAWAEQLPPSCRLLCECHQGTALERVEDAADFFEALDPARFGVVVHPVGDVAHIAKWFELLGPRIMHLHVQMRSAETDPAVRANRDRLDACIDLTYCREALT